jgi:hypothetical protein
VDDDDIDPVDQLGHGLGPVGTGPGDDGQTFEVDPDPVDGHCPQISYTDHRAP